MAREDDPVSSVIAAMARLEKVFQGVVTSSQKLKDNIEKSDELFGTSNKLKSDLQSALTSPVLFKKLNEVLARNLGGKAAPDIRTNLAKASALRRQWMASRAAQSKIATRIAALQAQRPHVATRQKLNALNQKIAALQAQHGTAVSTGFKQRWAMKAALARGQKAALGSGSKLGTFSKMGMLSKAVGFAGIAFNVATQSVQFFSDEIRKSGDIIAKYSRYSIGGLHAASLMYIKDINRNIYSSRALSGSMMEFARANSDMKDSWKNINVALEKLTLAFGTAGSKMGSALGRMLEPVAKGFDNMMGGLKKLTNAQMALLVVTSPLAAALAGIAKMADWKTQDEEMQELRARILRRKAAIQEGNWAWVRPGDFGKFEEQLLGIRPPAMKDLNRWQPPKWWVKPGPVPNPNNPNLPGGNQAPGIPGMGLKGGQNLMAPLPRPPIINPNQVQINKLDKQLLAVEKMIRVDRDAIMGLSDAIEEQKIKQGELEQGGLTPAEQKQWNDRQEKIDRWNKRQGMILDEEFNLRKQRDDLQDKRDALKKKDIGMIDPRWKQPGPGFGKPVGADLMLIG